MKKLVITLLVTALGCGVAAAQMAGGEMKPEAKKEMKMEKKGKAPKMNVCKGTVESVDMAANKIMVKDAKGMVMTMPLTAETKIMKNGKPAAMSDIMMGEKVHVMYEGEMANPMVKSVKIEKMMGKKEMEKKPMMKGEMKSGK